MRHPGLKARMLVMGSVLFGFYALLVLFFQGVMDLTLPMVLAGTLAFVAIQYKVGKYMAVRSVGAVDIPERGETSEELDGDYAWIHDVVDDLCADMDVEKPRLMIGHMGVPNAFAVGRKGAGVVVISDTLVDLLDRDELEGVIAHELAHIKNRDVLMMLLGQSIGSMLGITVFWVIALADDSIVGTLIGWIASILVQALVSIFVMAISRYREYVADSDAAEYTNNPEALGRALAKIHAVGQHEQAPDVGDNVGALCIFGGKRGLLATLFATHPAMEKRIEKLAPHLLEESAQQRLMEQLAGGI